MIYRILLGLHSWNRWIVLISAIALVVVAWRQWLGRAHTSTKAERASFWFIIFVDIQFLLGFLLLFFSPVIATFMQDPAGSMDRPSIRYWAVEHITLMLIATILAHAGRVAVKRAADARIANRRAAILFTVVLVILLASIPWPFLEWGRPLFFF